MRYAYFGKLVFCLLCSCNDNEDDEEVPADPVTLTVAGSWTECNAIEIAATAFKAKYPNVTIKYEYVQDYYESLKLRMTGENAVDLFFTDNIIQETSKMDGYALDVSARSYIDLSNTFAGIIENARYREEGAVNDTKLYAVPLGAEMRGMYVNKTLLKSVGINTVPANRTELLTACAVLKNAGYIPFHGNPSNFPLFLLYPWICNNIANAADPTAAHNAIASRTEESAELMREPFEFLYSLIQNDYYDYKTGQKKDGLNVFNGTADEDFVNYFLHIKDGAKADDTGVIAFMPATLSLGNLLAKTKEDYHSGIDYVFIPAPVGNNGGYAYMSPAKAIAINKDSAQLDWSAKFLSFLFEPETNETFCEAMNFIPNNKEAFNYVSTLFNIPDNNISHVGEVTFDYSFYDVIKTPLVDLSKANNPKYMNGTELYPFSHYWDMLLSAYVVE